MSDQVDGLASRAVEALRALGREPHQHQLEALSKQEHGVDGDLVLCAATGSGKSAAYMAAAHAAHDTLTVVVQPLVELIFEQTKQSQADLDALRRQGWPVGRAACSEHRGNKHAREAPPSTSAT